jgi:hypothetical protein
MEVMPDGDCSHYPFLDVLGTMLIFFAWVIWFWLLIRVFGDVFRRMTCRVGGRPVGLSS